jgi:hypothetical protein
MPPKQRKVADPTMGASAAANLGSQDRNSTKEDSEVVKDIGRLVFSPAELEILPKDYLSMQYLTLVCIHEFRFSTAIHDASFGHIPLPPSVFTFLYADASIRP